MNGADTANGGCDDGGDETGNLHAVCFIQDKLNFYGCLALFLRSSRFEIEVFGEPLPAKHPLVCALTKKRMPVPGLDKKRDKVTPYSGDNPRDMRWTK